MIFTNTLKTTVRRLAKNKLYVLVNVLSLALGLASLFFSFKYIQNELSYDRYHDDSASIYRLEYESKTKNGASFRFANLHGNVLPENIHSIPGILLNTRFAPHAKLNITVSDQEFGESNMLAADNSFFKLFTFEFINGNRNNSLSDPSSVVVSESTALKYFNTTDVMGETISIKFQGKEVLLTISGVIKNVPANSHFSFDLVTSTHTFEKLYGFSINEVQTAYNYIKISPSASSISIEEQINKIAIQDLGVEIGYFLQALTDIHLYSSSRGELSTNSDIKYLYFLSLITLLILGISCVNFTTLAIAFSINRSNEIGIRKTYGALRKNLVNNFLFEGILLSLGALIVAYFFIWTFLPYLNSLSGKTFAFKEFYTPPSFFLILTLSIFIGLLASLYPALISTKEKASSLLVKSTSVSFKRNSFWKLIIVFQFSITLFLISGSYIIHKQITFVESKDLGFEKEQIILIPNYFGSDSQLFLQKLNTHPNIASTTISSYTPGISKSSGTAIVKDENNPQEFTFDWISTDDKYLETFGIDLIEGRNFTNNRSSDSTEAFVINQKAVEALNWKDPLGKSLTAFGKQGFVIGVVKDFNFLSLHNEISPLIMTVNDQLYFSIAVKLHSNNAIPETISFIEKTWKKIIPGALFSYNFLDQEFNRVYEGERKMESLFFVFSSLAIFIAMLGLFSFASFSAAQNRKEIGIRKVLGASLLDVLNLFYSNYLKFLALAALFAFPAVYFFMNNWLQNFSYKFAIKMDVFFIPLLIAFLIILISVGYQTIRSALTNPIDTIRND
tara:strand:+ start:8799 stop:11162 length:2364 start_codon:yes stop_codon:yes gene_type:complete